MKWGKLTALRVSSTYLRIFYSVQVFSVFLNSSL